MLIKKRLRSVFPYFAFISAWIFLYHLPWQPAFVISLKNIKGTELRVTLQRSDGAKIIQTYHIPEKKELHYSALKLLSLETNSSEKSQVSVFTKSEFWQKEFNSKLENVVSFESVRQDPTILAGIALLSLIIFFLSWNLVNLSCLRPIFFIHSLIFMTLFYLSYPGIIGGDVHHYYLDAANYTISSFGGAFFSLIMIPLYQLFPHFWLLTAVNGIIIVVFLSWLYGISKRNSTTKFYFLACGFYFLMPIHLIYTVSPGRDMISAWLWVITLLKFYEVEVRGHWNRHESITFSAAFIGACLVRPESLYLLSPALLLYWFIKKRNLRWLLLTSLTPWLFHGLLQTLTNQKENDRYQASLLVNPLSYILKAKYASIPLEVDDKLGPYFKNDYLIEYQNIFDIRPFFKGGVNQNASHDDYVKFRSKALSIFLENPFLFLENRRKIATFMFGFSNRKINLFVDHYFSTPLVRSMEIQQELAEPSRIRQPLGNRLLIILSVLMDKNSFFFKTYIMAFLLLAFMTFWTPFKGLYKGLLCLLLARTLFVTLAAPAGYWKYHYVLWLFAIFGLPLLPARKELKDESRTIR